MGMFDNIRASDRDPAEDQRASEEAKRQARADEAWAHCEQVGRDAAALLLREGAPSTPLGVSYKKGVPAPARAWDLGRFWIDSDGRLLRMKTEKYWVNQWTPFSSQRTRGWLEPAPSHSEAIGYTVLSYGAPLPIREEGWDGEGPHTLEEDVAKNLRLILQGKRASYSPE